MNNKSMLDLLTVKLTKRSKMSIKSISNIIKFFEKRLENEKEYYVENLDYI